MAAADWDLEAEIDRLYETAPDDFVREREAVARRLRGERRRDEAKQVHALRKPSPAAWAINRVARREPGLAERVMAAGGSLREAQLALASGGGADALRAAAAAHHQAVTRYTQAARDALAARGVAGVETFRRIHETLLAAATDPELAELVKTGRVFKEQAPIGFGPLAAGPPAVPVKPKRAKARAPADDSTAREDARRRSQLQARVREARATEARTHEEAARLEEALDKAEQRRRKAREKLDEAEARAADLDRAAALVREEAERASARLEEAEADAAR